MVAGMPVPPIPPPLESLGGRPFSFYPPILGIEHNEWLFRRATWSEIQVVNSKTGEEIWLPRRFIGEVSRIDEPVMIVGLTKELEYKSGQVWPHERRVIQMPRAVNDIPRSPQPEQPEAPVRPAPVVGIRLESGTESRIGKLILAALVLGIVGCVVLVSLFRAGTDPARVTYAPVLQFDLQLSADADYFDVVRKLGPPAEDRWLSDTGELQYRLLRYPDRSLTVVLMGTERDKARYIGALDDQNRVVHSITRPGGANTASILRRLKLR
jgi:hypothetical protein